jgi:hypothetical protein
MTVRLAVLQHEPETGLGRFGELLADSGVEYEIVSTRGPLPDPLVFDAALCLGGSLAATDTSLLPARRWIRADTATQVARADDRDLHPCTSSGKRGRI